MALLLAPGRRSQHTAVERLAWSAARVFCLINGCDLRYDVDEAEGLVFAVAQGHLGVTALGEDLSRHLI